MDWHYHDDDTYLNLLALDCKNKRKEEAIDARNKSPHSKHRILRDSKKLCLGGTGAVFFLYTQVNKKTLTLNR